MRKVFIILLIAISLASCNTTKKIGVTKIKPNQLFFRYEELDSNNSIGIGDTLLKVIKTKPDLFVKKIDIGDDNYLYFKPYNDNYDTLNSEIKSKKWNKGAKDFHYPELRTGFNEKMVRVDSLKKYLVPIKITKYDSNKDGKPDKYEEKYWYGKSFKFVESEIIFQALSVPFKYRFPSDSVPYQFSTSGNLGIAYGKKIISQKYKPVFHQTNIINHNLTNRSHSYAGFIGLTIVELKTSNTKDLKQDRNVAGITVGGLYSFGINKFNIGFATGIDFGLGKDANNWRYQYIPWLGLVLALEFL